MTSVSEVLVFALICLPRPLEAIIHIGGDLEVVGMFQIHEKERGKCATQVNMMSVMTSEAVKWYIQQLNSHANLSLIIGFRGLETCRMTEMATEHAVELMEQVLKNESYIAGVVGPEFSSEVEVTSPIFSSVSSKYRLAQVGFSTTATSLNDKQKYPNFVRVIADDRTQIETMVKTMVALTWSRVAVIYEDDVYGREALYLLKKRTTEESICVSLSQGLTVDHGVDSVEISTIINDIILGNGTRPSINGVIFIGGSVIANTILLTMKNSKFAYLPLMMLSESSELNINVAKDSQGYIIPSAKGSLLLSPPYTEVAEFQAHWKDIFTNATVFKLESTINPWLGDLYYDITHCPARNCNFKVMSETEFTSTFDRQSLYVKYSIIAVHALIRAAMTVYSVYCSSNTGLCQTFREKFGPGDVLGALKNNSIHMETDFKFRLPSLANYSTDLYSVSKSATTPSYQVYNLRLSDTHTDKFDFVKIADLIGDHVDLDLNKLRDYDNTGAEKLWPDIRIPRCLETTMCAECMSMIDIHDSIVHDPGDLYVVGIVPVFDSAGIDGCSNIRIVSGYQTAESIRFAVEKANTKFGDFTNIFQKHKIGTLILNSCNSPAVIQRKIYDLYRNGIRFPNGTTVPTVDLVIGFVGDIGSSMSIAVAEVLTKLKYVQISFASTSSALSDRRKYPYFMRVVTPDDGQAKAMVEVIKKLKANFIQIIFSSGSYGEGGRDTVTEIAKANKICVINTIEVEESGNIYAIYEELRKNKHARIVIVFLPSNKVQTVLSTLISQMSRGEFIFLGSETWAARKDVFKDDTKQALLGSYTLSLEIHQSSELKTHMQNLQPRPYRDNPWVMTYLQAKYKCFFNESFDKTQSQHCSEDGGSRAGFTLDPWDTAAFVATKSLLLGASEHFQRTCGSVRVCADFRNNPQGLIQEIIKTKHDLDGSGNKVKVFDDNADGTVGYRIYNIQKDPDNPLQLVYREVGRFPLEGTLTFEVNHTVSPTGSTVSSTCPNDEVCAGCFEQSNVNAKSEEKLRSVNIGVIELGAVSGVAVLIIISLIITVVVLCGKRKPPGRERDSGVYITPTPTPTVEDSYSDIPMHGFGNDQASDSFFCSSVSRGKPCHTTDTDGYIN